jgi:2-aminoadipate transaminase
MDRFARRAATLGSSLSAGAAAGSISFDSGHAFPGVLPDLGGEAGAALSRYREETLQYAPRPGLLELREWIAGFMEQDGIATSADQVLVTNGAKHGIELICRLLLDEGDSIVVTAPTYFTAIPIFRSYGVSFVEVGQDREGLDVTELTAELDRLAQAGIAMPKFIYNVPDFHNPTGVTMSLARRRALVDLATTRRIPIVEDSPYRKVRFAGDSVPPVKALDPDGSVYYVGTFSKLMAPGLRVGWVANSAPLIARLIQLKADGGSCPLTQRIITEFTTAGRLDRHVARVQEVYRSNRDRMVAALRRELPEASFTVPDGGYYVWIALPEGLDADAVARRAAEAGVVVIPGSRFFAGIDRSHPTNRLRLAYSHAAGEEIDEGIRRLAGAVRAVDGGASVEVGGSGAGDARTRAAGRAS